MADFGLRKFVAISSGLMFYFFVGIEETVMTSYFSLEASKRGLDIVQIGLCFCMMDVSTFLFSFLAMFTITPSRERLFCVSGMVLLSLAAMATSVLQWVHSGALFFSLSVGLEFLVGIGSAFSLATTLPLITSVHLEAAGSITACAEALLNLGCLVGPPFGSVLYSYCGMFAPPLISGGLAALSAVVAAFYLPQNLSCSTQIRSEQLTSSGRTKRINGLFSVENHPARTSVSSLQTPLIGGGIVEASEDLMTGKQLLFDPWAYFKFVAKPGLIVLSLLGIVVAAQSLFFEVCLSLYLEDKFSMDAIEIGLMFLLFNVPNSLMVVLYGLAVDRGFGMHVALLSAFGFSATFFALFLPDLIPSLQTVWYLATMLVIAGTCAAGTYIPAYLIYERVAEVYGFQNESQTRFLVSTWINNLSSIGALAGATWLTGPMYGHYGFNATCLAISVCMFVFSVASLAAAAQMRLLKKLYYADDLSL